MRHGIIAKQPDTTTQETTRLPRASRSFREISHSSSHEEDRIAKFDPPAPLEFPLWELVSFGKNPVFSSKIATDLHRRSVKSGVLY